jgi:YVTN family beta-propeller protein
VRPDSLVEIDPATNRVVSVAGVGKGPDGIAFTRDAAWVVTSDRTVDRFDLRTRQVRAIGGIPVARAVAATLGDDVWVSSFEAPWVTLVARHGRLVGEDEIAIAAAPPRVRVPGSAEALTVGGGFLWVTSPKDSGGGNTVSGIDLRTHRLVSTTRVGRLPLFAAFGYGSLWVSNYKGNSVSVVRPGSVRAETVPVPDGPLGIAAGEGGIWVVAFWNAKLVRIDPETRRIRARIPIGQGPNDVTVGGGAVWTTDRDSQTITKVDPATDKVVATIQLPVAPYGIRFARGRLWVTTQRCGSPVQPCG